MNVYVRALASRAGPGRRRVRRARSGASTPASPTSSTSSRASGSCTSTPGRAAPVSKHDLIDLVEPMVDATDPSRRARRARTTCSTRTTGSRARSGHRLKHELDRPLVATFHTLARVKADAGIDDDPALRARIEHEIVALRRPDARVDRGRAGAARRCSTAPTSDRIEIVPPGVDHEIFRPVTARRARRRSAPRSASATVPVLLFVGRIQPLKGADLAVPALAELGDPAAVLLVVGGPSGPDGPAELARLHALVARARASGTGCASSRPSPTTTSPATTAPSTSAWSRATASRSAWSRSRRPRAARRWSRRPSAACARSSTTASPATSSTAATRPTTPAPIARLLADPELAAAMGANAEAASRRYAWSMTAARLAPALRGPARARAGLVSLTPDAAALAAAHELIDAHLCGPVRDRGRDPARRVRPRAAPLVRALRLRRSRRRHDLLRPPPAHAALRALLPARARRRGPPAGAPRVAAAAQPRPLRRPVLARPRRRRVPHRPGRARAPHRPRSSTGSSASCTS